MPRVGIATSNPPIRGHVAKLITERELVINKGSDDGVSEDMMFRVLDMSTESIIDPITGEDLGGVSRVKCVVTVKRVGERVSLAVLNETSSVFGLGIAGLFTPAPTSVEEEPRRWANGARIGDPVQSVPERPTETVQS